MSIHFQKFRTKASSERQTAVILYLRIFTLKNTNTILISQKRHIFKGLLAFSLVALLNLTTPAPAHAGVFDFITGILGFNKEAEAEVIPANSQTVDLLKPNLTSEDDEDLQRDDAGAAHVVSGPLRVSTEDEIYIPNVDTIAVYTVHEGDTLEAVAKMFDVTPNTILWANNLSSRKLQVGTELTILPVSGIKYTVKKGDTVKSIAKKYKGDVDDILTFNGITVDSLAIGSTILIPDGEIVVEKTATPKGKTKIKTAPLLASSLNLPNKDDYYIRPVVSAIRTTGLHGHNAVDLANRVGTSIRAAAAGTVIISRIGGWNGGYGNYVVISHPNGTQTLYAHLSSSFVSVGQTVAQGEQIALMGSTGKSTGPHLHFEIRGARNPF